MNSYLRSHGSSFLIFVFFAADMSILGQWRLQTQLLQKETPGWFHGFRRLRPVHTGQVTSVWLCLRAHEKMHRETRHCESQSRVEITFPTVSLCPSGRVVSSARSWKNDPTKRLKLQTTEKWRWLKSWVRSQVEGKVKINAPIKQRACHWLIKANIRTDVVCVCVYIEPLVTLCRYCV